jgi:hypothetical protein
LLFSSHSYETIRREEKKELLFAEGTGTDSYHGSLKGPIYSRKLSLYTFPGLLFQIYKRGSKYISAIFLLKMFA